MRRTLFVLKAANLGIITFYQFALIYVLTRVIGPTLYPWMVLLASLGNYVLSTDLGFAGYAYAHIRKQFLAGTLHEHLKFISHSVAIYMAVALASIAAVTVGLLLFGQVSIVMRLSLSMYFASIALMLPWALVRRISGAVDILVFMEALELGRRLSALVLALLMLLGLSFPLFSVLNLLAFGLGWIGVWVVMAKRGIHLKMTTPGIMLRFINQNRSNIALTGGLTGLQFSIANAPYLLLPLMFGAASVVPFDIFYKVCRFGAVAFSVPIETILPPQTRAFYAGDLAEVRRQQSHALLTGALIVLGAGVFLVLFGQQLFGILLNHTHSVPAGMRYVMIGMLAAMLIQSTAGSFLTAIGEYKVMTRIAAVTTVLTAAAVIVTVALDLSFLHFMILYVIAFGAHAAMYLRAFERMTKAPLPARA